MLQYLALHPGREQHYHRQNLAQCSSGSMIATSFRFQPWRASLHHQRAFGIPRRWVRRWSSHEWAITYWLEGCDSAFSSGHVVDDEASSSLPRVFVLEEISAVVCQPDVLLTCEPVALLYLFGT